MLHSSCLRYMCELHCRLHGRGCSLDASQEPVSVLSPEEGGKVQQQMPPAGRPQQVQHPISHPQGVMVLAILLQALHQLLVSSGRQSLLKFAQVCLCSLLPLVL